MAVRIDIPLRRNEVWARVFQLCDVSGQPYDLTDCTGQFHVRSRTNNTALVAAGTLDFADAADGLITAKLRADEGSSLYAYGSPLQTDNLPYDIRLKIGDLPIDIMAGHVVLDRGVSHD